MPELRRDPVTGIWIVVSTERTERPTDFVKAQHSIKKRTGPCPFCPGNEAATCSEVFAFRESGLPNQPGWTTRVVPNRYPVLNRSGNWEEHADGLYQQASAVGVHEVVIECARHVASLTEATDEDAVNMFRAVRERLLQISQDKRLVAALHFKNHGEEGGASLEHTHCQLIAVPYMPRRLQDKLHGSKRHHEQHGHCIYCDMLAQETADRRRLVHEDEDTVAFVPFAARFPFEIWLLPRIHFSHVETTPEHVLASIARTVRFLLSKVERGLDDPAYNFIVHNGPLREPAMAHFHWHIEIVPRTVRPAGFEWGSASFINPVKPEQAAERLRQA